MSGAETTEDIYVDPNCSIGPGDPYRLIKYRGSWLLEYFIPTREKIEAIEKMSLRSSDILLVSFPKSGTTWLQEIILQICCTNNPELAARTIRSEKRKDLDTLIPFVEYHGTDFDQMPDPRFFKFHLSFEQLPKEAREGKCKIIYIARDVRDVVVSFYHFSRHMKLFNYKGSVEDMCQDFLNDTVYSGPWLQHVKTFWERRNQRNVLFLTYEELKRNPHKEVPKLAEYLGVTLTQSQIDDIVVSTGFEKMQKNDAVNYSWYRNDGLADPKLEFMRKGITGDWKNHISQELGDAMDEKFLKPLRKCGLVFSEE